VPKLAIRWLRHGRRGNERLSVSTTRILNGQPTSLLGVIVKLELLFELSIIECGGAGEFPFPQLKLIAADIQRLNAQVQFVRSPPE
jgi:hypothetical protein